MDNRIDVYVSVIGNGSVRVKICHADSISEDSAMRLFHGEKAKFVEENLENFINSISEEME